MCVGDFFKCIFGFWSLVFIRMELHSEFAVRLLDIILRGRARDAEDFIVVRNLDDSEGFLALVLGEVSGRGGR